MLLEEFGLAPERHGKPKDPKKSSSVRIAGKQLTTEPTEPEVLDPKTAVVQISIRNLAHEKEFLFAAKKAQADVREFEGRDNIAYQILRVEPGTEAFKHFCPSVYSAPKSDGEPATVAKDEKVKAIYFLWEIFAHKEANDRHLGAPHFKKGFQAWKADGRVLGSPFPFPVDMEAHQKVVASLQHDDDMLKTSADVLTKYMGNLLMSHEKPVGVHVPARGKTTASIRELFNDESESCCTRPRLLVTSVVGAAALQPGVEYVPQVSTLTAVRTLKEVKYKDLGKLAQEYHYQDTFMDQVQDKAKRSKKTHEFLVRTFFLRVRQVLDKARSESGLSDVYFSRLKKKNDHQTEQEGEPTYTYSFHVFAPAIDTTSEEAADKLAADKFENLLQEFGLALGDSGSPFAGAEVSRRSEDTEEREFLDPISVVVQINIREGATAQERKKFLENIQKTQKGVFENEGPNALAYQFLAVEDPATLASVRPTVYTPNSDGPEHGPTVDSDKSVEQVYFLWEVYAHKPAQDSHAASQHFRDNYLKWRNEGRTASSPFPYGQGTKEECERVLTDLQRIPGMPDNQKDVMAKYKGNLLSCSSDMKPIVAQVPARATPDAIGQLFDGVEQQLLRSWQEDDFVNSGDM
ncbi:unnamed protein product [Amoebophrya sp. A25]|nr:unnamed protein product [Amoebophrya sp. A25]|eukprot:GSA25T00010361001.1